MSARDELFDRLRRDAYREGRFRLASGQESDFFIDCKRVILTAEGHRLTGQVLFDAVASRAGVTGVAGVALGGCPLVSAVSLTSALQGRPLDGLYVRKEAKDHGTGRRVEGHVPVGTEVVLLEDVLTTGGSARAAVEALRTEGWTVSHVIALVDRDEGAVPALATLGVTARGIFHRRDFVR